MKSFQWRLAGALGRRCIWTLKGDWGGDLQVIFVGDFDGNLLGLVEGDLDGLFNEDWDGDKQGLFNGDFNGLFKVDFDGDLLGLLEGDFDGQRRPSNKDGKMSEISNN